MRAQSSDSSMLRLRHEYALRSKLSGSAQSHLSRCKFFDLQEQNFQERPVVHHDTHGRVYTCGADSAAT